MRTRLVFFLIAILAIVAWGLWYSPLHQVRSISSVITIDTPANRVWQGISDFGAYRDWNPFLASAAGTLTPGSRLTISVRFGKRSLTFHPQVTAVDANRRLAWRETIVSPRVFEEEHEFEIEAIDQSHTRLIQSTRMRGVLVGLVWDRLSPELSRGLAAMNQALKRRLGQGAPGS